MSEDCNCSRSDTKKKLTVKELIVKGCAKIRNLKVKNLKVTKDSTVQGNQTVNGSIVAGTLNVLTNSVVQGNQTVDNLQTVGSLNVLTNSNVQGTQTVGSLNVQTNATIQGNLSVNGLYNNLGPSIQPTFLVASPDFDQNIIPKFSAANDYYIVQRHAGRYATSITTFPTASPGKFVVNFPGLNANNEWRPDTLNIIPPISSTIAGAASTTPGVPNVWAPPTGAAPGTVGDTRPLTEGGAQQLIAFYQYLVGNSILPTTASSYVNLHANLTRRTVQTASLFWKNVLGSPATTLVSLDNGWTAPQTVSITSVSNTTPIAVNVAPSTAFPTGTSVTINGTGIGSIDGNTFIITNTASSGTGGTTFTLDGTTASGASAAGTATANPPNPPTFTVPYEIVTTSSSITGDKIYGGTTATGYGNVPPIAAATVNGILSSTTTTFRQEIYDNGHTINFSGGSTNFATPSTAPVPNYEPQVLQILNRLLPVTGFSSADLSGSLQQMMDWIIQQYVDQGPWINSSNLSIKEYIILNNFYFSNIFSTGTANFAGPLTANLLADLNAWVAKSASYKAGIYSGGGNVYFAGHETTLSALMTALQITHDYHNNGRSYPVGSMVVFVRNKTTNNVSAFSIAPNPVGSGGFVNPPDINFHATLIGTTNLSNPPLGTGNIPGAAAANTPA